VSRAPVNFPLRVSAVTIDLDGTLLDTIPDLAAASNMMLEELGFARLEEARIRTFVGKGIARLVERTLEAALGELPPDGLRSKALASYERHYTAVNGRHTTIYAGVKEGLERLREKALPLACVTNKSERFTRPLLDRVGFSGYFRHVVSGDTLEEKKPHPAPVLHACRALGVEPRAMLVIGDSLNDAQAARAAGCPVFCVTYGYNEGHDIRSLDTDALLSSLDEAVDLIEKA
jgi:phosphoglycolate phosphatase